MRQNRNEIDWRVNRGNLEHQNNILRIQFNHSCIDSIGYDTFDKKIWNDFIQMKQQPIIICLR